MFDIIPARFNVWLMLLCAVTALFTMRTNMSISILAMVNATTTTTSSDNHKNATIDSKLQPDYGPRQDWTPYEQSLVLGAFFWGYLLTTIPLGVLTDKYALGRANVGVSVLASAVLTAATPLAVDHSLTMTLIARAAMGFVSGGAFPAMHSLIARWSPPNERSRFVAVLSGVDLGTVLAWSLCGLVIDAYGWRWSFYGNGAVGIVVAALWFALVHGSPAAHPRIERSEREYIEGSLRAPGASVKCCEPEKNGWPPFAAILTSAPFWALLVTHYGSVFGMYVVMTSAPRFMYEVLGFEMAWSGVVSSVSHVVRPVGSLAFAMLADGLISSGRFPRSSVRKGFVVFSHILAGLCFLLIGHVNRGAYTQWTCVACIVASALFNGAVAVTCNQNPQDLAPRYAGSLCAIVNAAGSSAGFLAPMLVEWVTREANTMEEWTMVFGIVGTVYIVSGCVFILIGSVDVQPWNSDGSTTKTSGAMELKQ